MINVLFDEHQEVLRLFNKFGVKYLLVGGYAVIYYGYTRTTGDMDLWIEPSNENKELIIDALGSYGIDKIQLDLLAKQDFTKHVVFSIGSKPVKVDFITKVNLVDFAQALERKQVFDIDGISVSIIQYDDLVLSKFNTGRPIDQADIEQLQKVNGDSKP